MQCRAMVITLGALAPTVNSINHTKPEFVCFLVSEKTLDTRTQVLDLIDCQPQTHTIITYDPQSVSVNVLIMFKKQAMPARMSLWISLEEPNRWRAVWRWRRLP